MKPFDPRLLRYATSARWQVLCVAGFGVANAATMITQAFLLAEVIVRGMAGQSLVRPLLGLAGVVAVRVAIVWGNEVASHRAAAGVKSQLRRALLGAATGLGPDWLTGQRVGDLTLLATRGIDALDDYFSRYLPALVLAACVPVAVVAVVVTQDFTAAVVITCTVPLIPVFAIVIGLATQRRADRQWSQLTTLAGHFLDVVEGLPTLVAFRRAKAQSSTIRRVTDEHRRASMGTLRLAFLSSTALELVATVSVALVAVSVGLRLVDGSIALYPALVVLILAPEAYWPLRRVGAEFHAAANGLAAAEQVFAVLEEAGSRGRQTVRLTQSDPASTMDGQETGAPAPVSPAGLVTTTSPIGVSCRRVSVAGRMSAIELEVSPGEVLAITGPSGCGKSTLLSVLLGFVSPTSGTVELGGVPVSDANAEMWRSRLVWVPQRPWLHRGTVADNVRLGAPDASDSQVLEVLAQVQLAELAKRGLGENGAGVSAGQRQRVALARALLRCTTRPGSLVLLDEPTSYVDPKTEAVLVNAVRRLGHTHTAIVVAHRPALAEAADRVVAMT